MILRRALLALLALAVVVTVAGCGSSSTTSSTATSSASSASDILRIPYLADMSVPDPDIFYDIEGNSVILSAYEGLLKYAPNTDKIVGDLATSWSESPDRLTYTFHLRPGVRFHDGSPFTAASVIASFKRRLNVGQAPAYMVKPIASMTTPTPLTLVVKLKEPVDPFLDYLASSWGPKMIGPEALVTHAGKDFGQSWLQTHDDGTGPYQLTEFARGRQYVLTRYENWWGTKPFFQKVLLKITPDIGTQQLELENGSVDGIMHSFPAANLSSLPAGVKVKLQAYVSGCPSGSADWLASSCAELPTGTCCSPPAFAIGGVSCVLIRTVSLALLPCTSLTTNFKLYTPATSATNVGATELPFDSAALLPAGAVNVH